jgi:hypothetical protein
MPKRDQSKSPGVVRPCIIVGGGRGEGESSFLRLDSTVGVRLTS